MDENKVSTVVDEPLLSVILTRLRRVHTRGRGSRNSVAGPAATHYRFGTVGCPRDGQRRGVSSQTEPSGKVHLLFKGHCRVFTERTRGPQGNTSSSARHTSTTT